MLMNQCSASNTNACTQNCTNTIDSFVCSCTSGYRLGSDGFTCEGIIIICRHIIIQYNSKLLIEALLVHGKYR